MQEKLSLYFHTSLHSDLTTWNIIEILTCLLIYLFQKGKSLQKVDYNHFFPTLENITSTTMGANALKLHVG